MTVQDKKMNSKSSYTFDLKEGDEDEDAAGSLRE